MSTPRQKMLSDMLEKDENDSFVRYALAKELETTSQLPAALEQYLILKSKDPTYVGLYYHLAKLYEILEQPSLALATYDEGLQIAKKIPDFHAVSELNNAKLNLEMEM